MINKTKQIATIRSILTALLNTYDETEALNVFEMFMKMTGNKPKAKSKVNKNR